MLYEYRQTKQRESLSLDPISRISHPSTTKHAVSTNDSHSSGAYKVRLGTKYVATNQPQKF